MSGRAGVLRTRDGRLRLGWRLVLFVVMTGGVTVAAGAVAPRGVVGASGALLAGAVVAGWVLLAADGRGPGALGFRMERGAVREVATGTAVGAGLALAVVLAMTLTGGLRWEGDDGSLAALAAAGVGSLAWLALPAAAEEALVRGYGFQALAESVGGWTAVAATSALFGAMHLSNPGATWLGAVNTGLAGVWLGVLVLRSGSLWLASGAHLGWNWAQAFTADVSVSGLDVVDTPLWDTYPAGPAWLGGGAFGPEGSVFATVAFAGATLAGLRLGWPSPSEATRETPPLFPLPGTAADRTSTDESGPEGRASGRTE